MEVEALGTFRHFLISAIFLGGICLLASPAAAQQGYYRGYYDGYHQTYRPYSYRSMSRTGKYHGYWRDLGYGFSNRGSRGYYVPQYYYGGNIYVPVDPAPPYYAPSPYGYR